MTDPRFALAFMLLKEGWAHEDMILVVFADHPFDDEVPMKRRLRKAILRRRRQDLVKGRKARQTGDTGELVRMARACLEDYLALARQHENPYYVDRFSAHLDGKTPSLGS